MIVSAFFVKLRSNAQKKKEGYYSEPEDIGGQKVESQRLFGNGIADKVYFTVHYSLYVNGIFTFSPKYDQSLPKIILNTNNIALGNAFTVTFRFALH